MDVPSRTLENLARGLAEKNLARSRYMLAAGAAHRDGLAVVELLFVRTAEQERVHGRQFARLSQKLGGAHVRAEGAYPLEMEQDTVQWLRRAKEEEDREAGEWREFARQAREDGVPQAADLFERVAQVDETHGDRFARWAGRLEDGALFARPLPCLWRCTVCGHTQYEEGAPERCPLCLGPQSQFLALEGEDWF